MVHSYCSLMRWPRLLIALSLTTISLDAALCQSATIQIFREQSSRIERGIFSDSDRAAIENISSDRQTSDNEKSAAIFELYIDRRLSLLPPGASERVRETLAKRVSVSTNDSVITGSYTVPTKRVRLWLPKPFEGGPVHYFLLTHEIEHAIQGEMLVENGIGFIRYSGSHAIHYGSTMFESERGSMIAEFLYLQSLPVEVRQRAAEQLSTLSQLDKRDRERETRNLLSKATTSADYLEQEWSAGRYRHDELKTQQYLAHTGLIGVAALVGTIFFKDCRSIFSGLASRISLR